MTGEWIDGWISSPQQSADSFEIYYFFIIKHNTQLLENIERQKIQFTYKAVIRGGGSRMLLCFKAFINYWM